MSIRMRPDASEAAAATAAMALSSTDANPAPRRASTRSCKPGECKREKCQAAGFGDCSCGGKIHREIRPITRRQADDEIAFRTQKVGTKERTFRANRDEDPRVLAGRIDQGLDQRGDVDDKIRGNIQSRRRREQV